uniref:Uncharacterized protein n=1 Tax=Octactis speculum TaxID=3111310 RepID=A0A7S2GDR4_9STRA|mmetsp:Transcript_43544/g.59471  ORF Transcript_43544/g.59471 Transcript_43544/m.59471 type:complete len:219 (+) Transcript_43544:213-869(+)|eukprot:CAMPEP_0185756238 /NCGR_PEP_ID=MMETSP1174-20130828/14662_1 /TAXON_ID=35687 /ORGANISM="Dictyocha speculum, Strain CCMP1381" /LENGTH=218 /DNA_ID=CAMNT_0028435111 /DNA_START=213 /DNA_END=869 /DNA_ORIENTATION=+
MNRSSEAVEKQKWPQRTLRSSLLNTLNSSYASGRPSLNELEVSSMLDRDETGIEENCLGGDLPRAATSDYLAVGTNIALEMTRRSVDDLTIVPKTTISEEAGEILLKKYSRTIDAMIAADVEVPEVFLKRSVIFFSLGSFVESKEDASRALELSDATSEATRALSFYRIGSAEYALGHNQVALEAFIKGAEVSPSCPFIKHAINQVFAATKKGKRPHP